MTAARRLVVVCGVVSTCLLTAGDLSTYRGFQFGMDVPAAAKNAGVKTSEARVVHERPVLIQELEWQPSIFGKSRDTNPIRDGLLTFYKGELFRIVVTYDREKVEGMTPDDMITAISDIYGVASKPKADIPHHANYTSTASVLARWENSEYSYNLVRSGYGNTFALVMFSKQLNALAAAAITEAVRMDAAEAPGREVAAKRKQQQDDELALEKARRVNVPNFRP